MRTVRTCRRAQKRREATNSNHVTTLFSIRDAAVYLGVPPETVRWWIRTGKLRKVKIGRRVLIRREDLDALIVVSMDEASESPRRPRDDHQELSGAPEALEGNLAAYR